MILNRYKREPYIIDENKKLQGLGNISIGLSVGERCTSDDNETTKLRAI